MGSWIESQSVYMQILVGESFIVLLKSKGFYFLDQYLIEIKSESLKMLQQWSADILEVWTEVYALVLAKLV